MDELVPWGTALPYRLDPTATGWRIFCISNGLWPCMSGCLSDNLDQFTPDAEKLLTQEVLTLNSSICISEIVTRLDAILQAIQGLDVCCALSLGSPGLDEPPDDMERGVGIPPVGETWEQYDAILCQSLQRQVDLCVDAIDSFTDGLGAIGLMGLDALALYLAPVAPPVSLLLALLGVLATILEDELYDQWAGELTLYAEDAICAAYLSYTPATAKAAIDAVIAEHVTPAPNRLLHETLWSQTQINAIFAGEIEGYEEYSPEYCEVCQSIPVDEWHFDGGLEGWFLFEGHHESELTYNASVSHTEDGTGSAQLWLDDHWFGQWWSHVQVNTSVEVVEHLFLEYWHTMIGDARDHYLRIIFDDNTVWEDETVGNPLVYPEWKYISREIPGIFVGKYIAAIRLSWEGNDDYCLFDDVRLFIGE